MIIIIVISIIISIIIISIISIDIISIICIITTNDKPNENQRNRHTNSIANHAFIIVSSVAKHSTIRVQQRATQERGPE